MSALHVFRKPREPVTGNNRRGLFFCTRNTILTIICLWLLTLIFFVYFAPLNLKLLLSGVVYSSA